MHERGEGLEKHLSDINGWHIRWSHKVNLDQSKIVDVFQRNLSNEIFQMDVLCFYCDLYFVSRGHIVKKSKLIKVMPCNGPTRETRDDSVQRRI